MILGYGVAAAARPCETRDFCGRPASQSSEVQDGSRRPATNRRRAASPETHRTTVVAEGETSRRRVFKLSHFSSSPPPSTTFLSLSLRPRPSADAEPPSPFLYDSKRNCSSAVQIWILCARKDGYRRAPIVYIHVRGELTNFAKDGCMETGKSFSQSVSSSSLRTNDRSLSRIRSGSKSRDRARDFSPFKVR